MIVIFVLGTCRYIQELSTDAKSKYLYLCPLQLVVRHAWDMHVTNQMTNSNFIHMV
ncbi:hypothetical protein COCC4DRAFT_33776 [Bipolaris maydis ATCC 48331]|uniref:Uncharacterized protein n=2 Tax=Cochliobolus heterostrophus TaxID=5016 RepID=M2U8R5_COCH5|nr:uncharacterized protein COCC4DRAFT_33776 [Bipolaris maydis ATCC 48331]EMD94979.1 hypothetical protein COCHEDRAFT_1019873 [Bipolaris maydis C5]ENI01730.1 hypothetical protein COCC4DRAFT_33776 [Bipolaris maydis ATCC 48331]